MTQFTSLEIGNRYALLFGIYAGSSNTRISERLGSFWAQIHICIDENQTPIQHHGVWWGHEWWWW